MHCSGLLAGIAVLGPELGGCVRQFRQFRLPSGCPCGSRRFCRALTVDLAADDVGGVGAVADAELAVGVLRVPFNGVHADHQDRGDLAVGTVGGQELEDLGLAAPQAVCPRRGLARGRGARAGACCPARRSASVSSPVMMPARVRALADELPGFAQTVLRVMGASHGTDPGNLLVSALPNRAHANRAYSAFGTASENVILQEGYWPWPRFDFGDEATISPDPGSRPSRTEVLMTP